MTQHVAATEADLQGDWSVRIPYDPEPEVVYFADEARARQLHEVHKRDDSWGSTLYRKEQGKWLAVR